MAKKTPGIKNVGRNRWEVRATRKLPDGRRRDRVATVEGTRRQAEAERARLLEELERERATEIEPDSTRLTLTDYAQRWLRRKVKQGLKPSTIAHYTYALEHHILPALGRMLLEDLRPGHVNDWLVDARGAPRSVSLRLTLLRQVAKDSYADGFAPMDWTFRVRGPKVPRTYTDENPNLHTLEQAERLLGALRDPWYTMAYVFVLTGIRWGELTALLWTDVDIENAVLRIRQGNWKGHISEPKTEAAIRTIPLERPLPELLAAHRARMLREQHPGLASGLVFPTQNGIARPDRVPYAYRGIALQRVLDQACEDINERATKENRSDLRIPRITVHGLRRTFNNELRKVTKGVVLRSLMGHTREAMSDHYSHVAVDEKRAAVKHLADRLRDKD